VALVEYAGPEGGGVVRGFRARPVGSLLRTALLLTGQSRAEAEDLLQLALERAYRHWPRICKWDEPERYVRRILASASADRWRRLARRRAIHSRTNFP
jgi:DNA-directed RNA polymerase specialized sigma24 family protein